MNPKINLQDLLSKFHTGELTDEERVLLEDWYLNWKPGRQNISHQEIEELKSNVWESLHVDAKPVSTKRLWPGLAIAASLIFCLSAGGYFILDKKPAQPQLASKVRSGDIAPGGNRAVLTLNNGLKINLNSQVNGTIAQQGNARVVKMSNGRLAYALEDTNAAPVVYNTLSTPRGGKYDLVLSDGSKVWLNSASSITYPTVFKEKNREVTITGEVFFEIAHNAKQPFKVNFKGQTVEDLGTQFNINAYDDEPVVRTSLVEGCVRVSKGVQTVKLRPGQQSITSSSNAGIQVGDADISEVTAWKNGMFKFKKANIEDVMRQLSRWYDVDISYPYGIPRTVFSGEMIKDANASQILDMLAYFKVKYEIVQQTNGTGKKIIIKP